MLLLSDSYEISKQPVLNIAHFRLMPSNDPWCNNDIHADGVSDQSILQCDPFSWVGPFVHKITELMTMKIPDAINKHVGSRIRMQRLFSGMSQESLGEFLGLTFQQLQKYEKGTIRIGAGRLLQFRRSPFSSSLTTRRKCREESRK
jgi:DNA-binding XRE family transcriptional regulator